jgi:hypothetical protein
MLSAGLLISNSVQAASPEASCETFLLPSPADALADYIGLTSDIQLALLRPYYTIIRNVSTDMSKQYAQLKRLVGELETLAPALRTNETVSRVKDFTDMGRAGTESISRATSKSMKADGGYITLVAMTSEKLNVIAEGLSRQGGPVTLSVGAAEKVREILRRIKELNKPTDLMQKASTALTDASNNVSKELKTVKGAIKDAIHFIVQAETQEMAAAAGGSGQILPGKPSPAGSNLRGMAVKRLEDAIGKLEAFPDFSPPTDLQPYMAASQRATAQNDEGDANFSMRTIASLLRGTKGWIQRGNVPPVQRAGRAAGSVIFLPVASKMPIEFWGFTLYRKVRDALAEVFPEATRLRILNVGGKLLSLSDFNEDERTALLYKLLPDITPEGAIDLSLPANDGKRQAAAKRLAGINV